MLDDLKYIHQHDTQDALGLAAKQSEQYSHSFGFSWQPPRPVRHIVVAGMGGSGLAAKVAQVWPGPHLPFELNQDYDWPEAVDANTLLICSSYSGNTEETITILERAVAPDLPEELRPMTVVIASGGKLQDIARTKNLPILNMPTGLQPRMTFGYQLRALTEVFTAAGICHGAVEELEQAAAWLQPEITGWLPTVPAANNFAKQIAQECMGRSPVIYAGPKLFPAAYKWKISFNENAKNVAWCGALPEFDHNEFIGWASHPVDKPYAVIDLRSNLEHPRVQKRFGIAERLLSGKRPAPEVVEAKGDTSLQQLLWTVTLGDFVSLYLAMLNGVDPTPVELVEKLKQLLNET